MNKIENQNLMGVNISPDLFRLKKSGMSGKSFYPRFVHNGDDLFCKIPYISLNVIPLSDALYKKYTQNSQVIDCFYNFFDGGFSEKAKYKFSSWESMVLGLEESMDSLTLAVKGDFFLNGLGLTEPWGIYSGLFLVTGE